jgi:lipopolysaccharide/colanic/teichoic acid biosynthesis glycosyltransferase
MPIFRNGERRRFICEFRGPTMNQIPAGVSPTWWARGGKRLGDIVGSALLLILLAPILLIAAVLVKTTSPGPLLFSQDRGGKDGRPFRVIKFRTMRGGRRPDPKELVPLHHPEITPVGWFLRRFKIDELPQLVNVLRGEMSLVGPRPTLLDQVAAYDEFRRQRLLVRPGCTGLAQVNTSAAVSWDERILYDIAYVRRCSFVLDMSILSRTIFVLLVGEERIVRPFHASPYAPVVTPPDDYPLKAEARSGEET